MSIAVRSLLKPGAAPLRGASGATAATAEAALAGSARSPSTTSTCSRTAGSSSPACRRSSALPLDQHRADRRARAAHRHDDLRLPGLAARRARQGARAQPRARSTGHHVAPRARPQRGARRDRGVGHPARGPAARLAYDGVLGVWYGKAPGVDRAADAIRHGNFVGRPAPGGVARGVRRRPGCKSSTLPSASESLLAALQMPVLYPGSVQEVLDLGRHAIALLARVRPVGGAQDRHERRRRGRHRRRRARPRRRRSCRRSSGTARPTCTAQRRTCWRPQSLEMERTLLGVRARAGARATRASTASTGSHDAPARLARDRRRRQPYHDLLQALATSASTARARARRHPDPQAADALAARRGDRARVRRGPRRDRSSSRRRGRSSSRCQGRALRRAARAADRSASATSAARRCSRASCALDADAIARAARRAARAARRADRLGARRGSRSSPRSPRRPAGAADAPQRTPFFCSGCPHNSSTAAPDGTLVGAGIGCHTMVLLEPRGQGRRSPASRRWAARARSGSAWRRSPTTAHFVQNLGDGTFHHSGSLAIRAAVAAGVNITYKLLYNEHVAMTGGQASRAS